MNCHRQTPSRSSRATTLCLGLLAASITSLAPGPVRAQESCVGPTGQVVVIGNTGSFVCGTSASVLGLFSTAVGCSANADGPGATALGANSNATGESAIAVGAFAQLRPTRPWRSAPARRRR